MMNRYAPFFCNAGPGRRQRSLSLIGDGAMSSFGSPAYFVPKMFADNRGDIVLSWSLDPLSYSRDNLRIPFFASGKVRARSLTGMNLEFFSGLSTTT